jgi:dsRNA-specific ribonuclease
MNRLDLSGTIHKGLRDSSFYQCIRDVLKRGKLTEKYIDKIMDEEGKKEYNKVFTHESVDPVNNYEYHETLGDVTINKSIVWYYNSKYPKLRCTEGRTVMTKIKAAVGSKSYLYKFAESLGFWKYVTITEEQKQRSMKSTLEDILEAFIGCTEFLINEKIYPTSGYSICFNIISSILSENEISLKYTDLVDAITRLKEIGDKNKQISKIQYDTSQDKTQEGFAIFTSTVIITIDGKQHRLGTGIGAKQALAKTIAAENSIPMLKQKFGIEPVYPNWEKYL